MNEKQPIPLRLLGAWVGSYLSAPPLLRIYAGAGRPPAVLLRSSKRVTAPVSAVCTYYLYYDIELFEGWDGVCVYSLRRRFLPSSKNAACPADLARFGAGSQQN